MDLKYPEAGALSRTKKVEIKIAYGEQRATKNEQLEVPWAVRSE